MNRIRELRKSSGITQRQLADFIGTSQQTISRVEKESDYVSTKVLIKAAGFFEVSVEYLLGLTDERSVEKCGRGEACLKEKHSGMMEMFDGLNDENKSTVREMVRIMLGNQTKTVG